MKRASGTEIKGEVYRGGEIERTKRREGEVESETGNCKHKG